RRRLGTSVGGSQREGEGLLADREQTGAHPSTIRRRPRTSHSRFAHWSDDGASLDEETDRAASSGSTLLTPWEGAVEVGRAGVQDQAGLRRRATHRAGWNWTRVLRGALGNRAL